MSHNNMSSFFSTTDMSELEDNCQSYDFYLSLIVNNKLDTCAKIAIYAIQNIKSKQDSFIQIRDGNGLPLNIDTSKQENRIIDSMLIVDVDVEILKPIVSDKFFKDRVDFIISEADKLKYSKSFTSGFNTSKFDNPTNFGSYNDCKFDCFESDYMKNPQDYNSQIVIDEDEAKRFLGNIFSCKENELGGKFNLLSKKYKNEDRAFDYIDGLMDEENEHMKRCLRISLGSGYDDADICSLFSMCCDYLVQFSPNEFVVHLSEYFESYIEETVNLMNDGGSK